MSTFNKAITEQLKMLYEAPRRRSKVKNKTQKQSEPCPSTPQQPRRIFSGTGTGKSSGV